tara:strand:- start:140 stop:1288 length:1149 start_codon:yes stop_codon:yes gene_type:complete
MSIFKKRINELQKKLEKINVDVAIITNEDNVYYLTGYYDYLHMEFGRPTILIISINEGSLLITPSIDENMAKSVAQVDRIIAWNDGLDNEWRSEIPHIIKTNQVGIELNLIPQIVKTYIEQITKGRFPKNISPILEDLRMIKSNYEIQLAKHAGQVANAMMIAGRQAIKEGVAEYEVALAISESGTKKAAYLLDTHYTDKDMSPITHFLQIMASGETITKTHHRASTRIIKYGDPIFLCFCGMTNFHRFKLGFDRTFWLGEIKDPLQEKIYNVAVASQEAALNVIRPGVTAESVHREYASVIRENGYDYPFRCGRATGFSFLEKPQLVSGDKTILKKGMVLAVDGSITVDNFRAQVGDSIIITDKGYEFVTHHPKKISEVIL